MATPVVWNAEAVLKRLDRLEAQQTEILELLNQYKRPATTHFYPNQTTSVSGPPATEVAAL